MTSCAPVQRWDVTLLEERAHRERRLAAALRQCLSESNSAEQNAHLAERIERHEANAADYERQAKAVQA